MTKYDRLRAVLEALARLRDEAGLTDEELARYLGLPERRFLAVMRGGSRPTIPMLQQVALRLPQVRSVICEYILAPPG